MVKLVIEPIDKNRVVIKSCGTADPRYLDELQIIMDVHAGFEGRMNITFSFPQLDVNDQKEARNIIIVTNDGEIVAQECIPQGVVKG